MSNNSNDDDGKEVVEVEDNSSINNSKSSPVVTFVDSIAFSFQAHDDLRNFNGDIQVPKGSIYRCCISKSTSDMGILCCHYAKLHGLEDSMSKLRFYCDQIRFVWTLYPHTINMGQDIKLEEFEGVTITVSQQAQLTEHVSFWVKAGEQLFCNTNATAAADDDDYNDKGGVGGKTTKKMLRVKDGMLYSCLMLKNQRFASLFKHYAKMYHLEGQFDDDDHQLLLEYRYKDVLIDSKDTPTTINLEWDDAIVVKSKRKRHNMDRKDEAK